MLARTDHWLLKVTSPLHSSSSRRGQVLRLSEYQLNVIVHSHQLRIHASKIFNWDMAPSLGPGINGHAVDPPHGLLRGTVTYWRVRRLHAEWAQHPTVLYRLLQPQCSHYRSQHSICIHRRLFRPHVRRCHVRQTGSAASFVVGIDHHPHRNHSPGGGAKYCHVCSSSNDLGIWRRHLGSRGRGLSKRDVSQPLESLGPWGTLYMFTLPRQKNSLRFNIASEQLLLRRGSDCGWHHAGHRQMAVNLGLASTFSPPGHLLAHLHLNPSLHPRIAAMACATRSVRRCSYSGSPNECQWGHD